MADNSSNFRVRKGLTLQGDTSGAVDLAAPAVAGSQSYTLPTALPASNGYVLASTTGGTMSWVDNSATGTTYTIDASTTTGGANFNLVGSDSTTDTVKFASGTNVTVSRTDANTITIASTDTNTTYTVDASSITGGANLNLVGSDSTTDSVAYLGSGATTVTRTDANTITIASTDANTTYTIDASSTTGGANFNLVGSDSSTDTVKIASGTGITVSQTDANTITITNSDPGSAGVTSITGTTNQVIASASTGAVTLSTPQDIATTSNVTFGTVDANLTNNNYILGQVIATRDNTYTPPNGLTSAAINGFNGLAISTSTGGYPSQIQMRYQSGDSGVGTNISNAFIMGASQGSSTAPTQGAATQVLGAFNFDSYTGGTSNNWASVIASSNAGFGSNAVYPLQIQVYSNGLATNSTTVTDAITGASWSGGTATVNMNPATLTPPYAVGQTVTISGVNPSGYDGTVVITARTFNGTTNSISYALVSNPGAYVSGGTIGAANTVTNAPTGIRFRSYDLNQRLTQDNRVVMLDMSANNFTMKSNAYTFQNKVVSSSANVGGVFNYLTLGATGATLSGDLAVNGGQATLSMASAATQPYLVGQRVVIAGVTPSGYNGTFNIVGVNFTAGSTNQIIVTLASDPGTWTSGGTITYGTVVNNITAATWSGTDITTTANTASVFNTNATTLNVGSAATTMRIGAGSGTLTIGNPTVVGSSTSQTLFNTATTLNIGAATGTTIINNDISVSGGKSSPIISTFGGSTFITEEYSTNPYAFPLHLAGKRTDNVNPQDGDFIGLTYQAFGSGTNFVNIGTQAMTYKTSGDNSIDFFLDNNAGPNVTTNPITISAPITTFRNGTNASVSSVATFESAKVSFLSPVKFPTYTATAANAITGAVGWQISISDSPTVGGRMAFWDTTNSRWSYISDNSAV